MKMKKQTTFLVTILCSLVLVPVAYAITASVIQGEITDIGTNEVLTSFGMLVGKINFKLGNFSWVPKGVWLLPSNIDPEIFSKGLTQLEVLEIPENVTFSTCRTAVYQNKTLGYGFKIYNTGTTNQILQNGTFCGLAYNGTYYVFAKY